MRDTEVGYHVDARGIVERVSSHAVDVVGRYLPSFGSVLDDLSRVRADVILTIARAPSGTDAFAAVASHIDRVTERPKEWVESELSAVLARASKEQIVLTVAEQYMESGREEGRARMRALLLRQLTVRFGPVGDDVKAHIAAADVETVERWFDRLLTASAVADVFGEG